MQCNGREENSSVGVIYGSDFFREVYLLLSILLRLLPMSMNMFAFRIFSGIDPEKFNLYVQTSQPDLQT